MLTRFLCFCCQTNHTTFFFFIADTPQPPPPYHLAMNIDGELKWKMFFVRQLSRPSYATNQFEHLLVAPWVHSCELEIISLSFWQATTLFPKVSHWKYATETFYYISLLLSHSLSARKAIWHNKKSRRTFFFQIVVVVEEKENERDYMHFAVDAVIGIHSREWNIR